MLASRSPATAGRADDARSRVDGAWLAWAASAPLCGLLLAALLIALAPARSVVRIGEPGGLVPPMLSGVHAVERDHGIPMRWTNGHARLRWLGRYGAEPRAVVVTLAGFPGRHDDGVEIQINGHSSRHAITAAYSEIRASLPAGTRAPLDIAIGSATTQPDGDGRQLGVRVRSVAIEHPPRLARYGVGLSGIGIVFFGAIAWLAGAWAAGPHTTRSSRLRFASLAWLVAAMTAAVLAPTALRADTWLMLGPVAVGTLVLVLLARAGHGALVACGGGLVLAAQGMVITTWCVSAFVDAPRWDIWEMVPMLARQEAVGLTLADLWAPHNEHRPLVARAVVLTNVALARWNHWNELWLILVVSAAHVVLLAAYVGRCGVQQRLATLIMIAGLGTFIASATQWENFLQGWQIALIVGAAGVSAAFLLMSVGRLSWARLAGAAACVTVGVAGFASCLLAWPLGAAAIVARRDSGWRAKLVAWLACAGLVGYLFMHGLIRPEAHPSPAPILTSFDALSRVIYGTCLALAMPVWYVADPFAATHRWSPWVMSGIGALTFTASLWLIGAHVRRERVHARSTWIFPALLVLFAVGATGIAAIGRVPLGLHAMTASRYIVFTASFWVGLLLLLTVSAPFRSSTGRNAGLVVAMLIVLAGLRAWGDSLPQFEQHYVSGALGREALLRTDWPHTLAIYPVPPVLDERRQYLQRHGLSLYRPGAR